MSWKLTLPCTRAEAEAIDAGDDLGIDPPPVLMTSEEVTDDPERWRLDAYFEHEPDAATIAAVRDLVPSAAGVSATAERLPDADWVTMSQAGLEPVRAGRFVVHTSAHSADPPVGGRAFLIEAAQAFGTGHHETTAGCLAMIDGMAERAFRNIVDLGTGTGLLAFAARHLWPQARVIGTDIDPIAIEVTRENAALNRIDRVELVVADGTRDPVLADAAPFDLVIANILAGPLIAMAPEIAAIAAPGAAIVLAGLLETQRAAVEQAYRAAGCTVEQAERRGDWAILRLSAGAATPDADRPGEVGALGGRGAWATDG